MCDKMSVARCHCPQSVEPTPSDWNGYYISENRVLKVADGILQWYWDPQDVSSLPFGAGTVNAISFSRARQIVFAACVASDGNRVFRIPSDFVVGNEASTTWFDVSPEALTVPGFWPADGAPELQRSVGEGSYHCSPGQDTMHAFVLAGASGFGVAHLLVLDDSGAVVGKGPINVGVAIPDDNWASTSDPSFTNPPNPNSWSVFEAVWTPTGNLALVSTVTRGGFHEPSFDPDPDIDVAAHAIRLATFSSAAGLVGESIALLVEPIDADDARAAPVRVSPSGQVYFLLTVDHGVSGDRFVCFGDETNGTWAPGDHPVARIGKLTTASHRQPFAVGWQNRFLDVGPDGIPIANIREEVAQETVIVEGEPVFTRQIDVGVAKLFTDLPSGFSGNWYYLAVTESTPEITWTNRGLSAAAAYEHLRPNTDPITRITPEIGRTDAAGVTWFPPQSVGDDFSHIGPAGDTHLSNISNPNYPEFTGNLSFAGGFWAMETLDGMPVHR